ncbi:hypothetical protein Dimus_023593 [Dionaea muscipula]
MQRSISRCMLQCIGELFSRPVRHKKGRNNVAGTAAGFQTVVDSEAAVPTSFLSGGESITGSFAVQIVNALRLGDRSRAINMLSSFTVGGYGPNGDDFLFVLDHCARSPDPLFVIEMWRILEEKGIVLGDKCCLLMVRALCRGGYLEEAFHLLRFLGDSNRVSFIFPLYNEYLSTCIKMRSAIHANQCLGLMDSKPVGKNEATYNVLLKLAVWQQNLSAVHEIWREYMKYYNFNIISLRKFIWSFTRLKDLESAYRTLQHLVALAFEEGPSLKKNWEGKLRWLQLDIPIPLENINKTNNLNVNEHPAPAVGVEVNAQASDAQQLAAFNDEGGKSDKLLASLLKEHKKMPIKKVLRWSFNDVIHGCAQTQNSFLAEKLFLQMQSLGLDPSCHTYDGYIRAIIRQRGFGDGIELLKKMQTSNLKPYNSTLATVAISCSRALDLDLAEELLNGMSGSPYPLPYNAFLAACDTLDQPERAVCMLAKMIKWKVKPDIRTYELLFSLFGNVNAPYEEGNMLSQVDVAKRISAIELDMMKNGVQHSQLSMMYLLKALGNEGMIEDLMQYLHRAEQIFFQQNVSIGMSIYNTVLHSLAEAKQSHMAIETFRIMRLCGISPDDRTYNIMINCCSEIRNFKSASALISLMIRGGYYPQTLTYTALIQILLECNDFDGALNLLDQAISEGNELDVLLFNTILMKASFEGRIEITELVIEWMHQKKIQPDPSTCSYVFCAYAEHDFFNTAVEALQVLSMRMISLDDDILEETRIEFEEDYILAEDPEADLRIIQIFHRSDVKLAAALLNLRWCYMVGSSSISWSPDESSWARRLASWYSQRTSCLNSRSELYPGPKQICFVS